MYTCANTYFFAQVHGTQHSGPCSAVGSAGSTGHAHETQSGTANPGPQYHWRVRRNAQRIHHHVQVRVLLIRNLALYSNCWFTSDVTAATLVVKNKSISLRWEMDSILIQIWQKNFFCIDHQHGRPVTWLQTKNTVEPLLRNTSIQRAQTLVPEKCSYNL